MSTDRVRRFFTNSLAVYGKNGFHATVSLLSVAMLARYLTLPSFGRYSFVLAFVAVFRVMSSMGLNTILVREIAKNRAKAVNFYASALVVQGALSIITYAIIAVSINIAAPSDVAIKATYLCAAAVILEFIGKTFSAVFQAFERMEFDTYKTLLSQAVYFLGIVTVVKFDLGFLGVFYALVISGILDVVYGFFEVQRRFIPFRLRGHLAEIRFLIKEAIPLGLKRLIRRLSFRVDTLIIAALGTKAEVGLFHGMYKIVQAALFLAEGSMQAMFPILSQYHANSQESFDMAYGKAFKFLTIIGIPLSLFLCFFSQEVIALVLGEKFVQAEGALRILSGVLGLMFLSNLTERILTAAGRQGVCTGVTALALVINVGLDFLFIPRWGYTGASVATLIAEFVLTGVSFSYVHKLASKNGVLKEAVKPACCGMAALLVLYLLRNTNVFLAAFVGAGSYIALLVLTKTFTPDEKLLLLRACKKA